MKPGIYYDMSETEYHSVVALSYTGLKEFAESPAHFQLFLKREMEFSKSNEFFKAVHLAILEPDRWDSSIAIINGHGASNAVKEARRVAKEEGKLILDSEQSDSVLAIKKSFDNNGEAYNVVSGAKTEVSLFWEYEGILCKVRIDILSDQGIFDLKSFSGFSQKEMEMQFAKMKYHWQAFWYAWGWLTLTGEIRKSGIIFVEGEAPYRNMVADIKQPALDKAMEEIMPYVLEYKQCLANNEWPKQGTERVEINLPVWALQ